MTVTRNRPVLLNVTGTGQCTMCGCHARVLYPVWRDGSEVLYCANCKDVKP